MPARLRQGRFDDLEMLASFAQQNDLWFHVDGAHGAAHIFSERNKAPLKGMERADSVAMDFHKMLGVPALCTGLVLPQRFGCLRGV